jgi:N-acetylglucosamine-6-phosphate deacetylase
MPSAISQHSPNPSRSGIIKFTNCRLVRNNRIVQEDLWISQRNGRILDGQKVFYEFRTAPDHVIDLKGRIVAPGLIDVQLNGAFGFDFSVAPEDITQYPKNLSRLNRNMIATGVTSYLPTLTSQKSEVYHKVNPRVQLRV